MNHFDLEQFASYCGQERYEKFLATLRQSSKTEGRLFYWQEELLRRFSDETGVDAPNDLEAVLEYYRCPSVHVSAESAPAGRAGAFRLTAGVQREFRSVNQAASSGSYIAIFRVSVETPDGGGIVVRDRAAPHERRGVAEELLAAIAAGVERFVDARRAEDVSVPSLTLSLLGFHDHPSDLKPFFFTPATWYLLEDLYGEYRLDRVTPTKLVGIPF